MEGEGFYIFLLLVLLIGGPIGLVFLIRWACKSDSRKMPVKTQHAKLKPLDEMAKNLTQDERAQIFSQMDGAKRLAIVIGNPLAYYKHEEDMLKMILIHKGNEKIVNAEIIYFVYGIHDLLKTKLSDKFAGELFKNVEFIEKVHMPVIGIITDTPPKQLSCSDYANMVCELLFAQSDNEFLSIFDKYNYEYPDRIKKMLSNDIDVLAETAFYGVAMTIQTSKVKYLNKGLMIPNFILYYYAIYRSVIFSCEIDEKQKSHFERTLKKHFIEYCKTMKMFKSKEEAEAFFNSRYTKYSELVTFEDDETTLEALDELIEFVKKEFTLSRDEEADVIEEATELMELLRRETRTYFSKMLDEYERLSIVSTLDNVIEVIEKEIESQKEKD